MTHDEDRLRRTSIFRGVNVSPPNRLGDVTGLLLHRHVGHEAIIDGHEHEAPFDERFGLLLHARFVPVSPTATVNPYGDWGILAIMGRVQVESSLRVGWLREWNFTLDFGLGGEGRGHDQQDG